MMFSKLLLAWPTLFLSILVFGMDEVHLQVNTKDLAARNKTAPNLYGLFFEDINHSGDGGLYAETIRNRAFQGSGAKVKSSDKNEYPYDSTEAPIPFGPNLEAWRAIGDVQLSIDLMNPLSDALPAVLRVDIGENATGEVGFLNEGYWGIDVRPQRYNASFYIKPSDKSYDKNLSSIILSLRSNLTTSDVWATERIHINSNGLSTLDYTQLNAIIEPKDAAPSINNSFSITMEAKEVKGQTFFFSLVSLFPPTFKDRPNGFRPDLAMALKGLNPKFLRFPGGNNLEGYSIETRWKWNETIGDLRYRKGRIGQWEYFNTDGMGLGEFLDFCEDIGMEPLLSVWAGYALPLKGPSPGPTVPKDRIQPFVDEVLDELEYILGDAKTTKYGALRASHGRREPWKLKLVEIGNEDQFSDSYGWRFPIYHDQITKKYPDITCIATTGPELKKKLDIPGGAMWDAHYYQTPEFYKKNFGLWDNFGVTSYRNVTVFVGEYSVLSTDTPSGNVQWHGPGRIVYPTLDAAIGEAIFGLGLERNPNVVKLSSYAPLFQNLNSYEWTPDLISFTANPDETTLSASYYQQKLFSHHRGTETLPVKSVKGKLNPLWWAAQHDSHSNSIYVKLVNAADTAVPLTLEFDFEIGKVNGTILTHEKRNGFNYLNNQTAISLKPLNVSVETKGLKWVWDVPKASIVVLEFQS